MVVHFCEKEKEITFRRIQRLLRNRIFVIYFRLLKTKNVNNAYCFKMFHTKHCINIFILLEIESTFSASQFFLSRLSFTFSVAESEHQIQVVVNINILYTNLERAKFSEKYPPCKNPLSQTSPKNF